MKNIKLKIENHNNVKKNSNTISFFVDNQYLNEDWGLGIGDWGLGPIPNPQSPIPNPQSPIIFL